MVFTLTLLLLADIGPPPPECVADRECVLTTFGGCCGDCCPGVRAAPRGKDERAPCKTMKCAQGDCASVECSRPAPDLTLYVAACVSRRCEAVLKTAQCRVDADCRLSDAVPAPPCAPGTCPAVQAQPRDAGPPPPPRCEPCQGEVPARAACRDGRCAVVRYRPGSKKR